MKRKESFDVDVRSRLLVRSVVPSRGKPYDAKSSREVLAKVCHYAQARDRGGFTTSEMWQDLDVPKTQASTALAFLKEQGLVEVSSRRIYPATDAIFEHSMTDYYYLAHLADGGDPDLTEEELQAQTGLRSGLRLERDLTDAALGITTGSEPA
jgi:DNA-binding transcriptional regulator LsrR (DeoR family)